MTLDLHLHSTVSDGRLTPSELVRFAHSHGVTTMALSDHDATDGVDQAQQVGELLGMRVIPAIELSTDLPGASNGKAVSFVVTTNDPAGTEVERQPATHPVRVELPSPDLEARNWTA